MLSDDSPKDAASAGQPFLDLLTEESQGSPELNQVGLCEENAVGSWPKMGQDSSQVWCEQNPWFLPHCLLPLGLSTISNYSPERVPVLQEFMEESPEPGTQRQLRVQASDTLLALLVVEDTSHKAQMGPFQHQDLLFCKGGRSTSSHHQPSSSDTSVLPQKIPDPNSMHSSCQTHHEFQNVESSDLKGQNSDMATDNLLAQIMLAAGNPILMKDVLMHSSSYVLKEDALQTCTSAVQTMMDPQLKQKAEGKQQSSHDNMPYEPGSEWVLSLCNAEMPSELSSITDQVLANAQPFIVLERKSQEDLVLVSHGRTSGTQNVLETQGDTGPVSPGWSSSSMSEGSSGGVSMVPGNTETLHYRIISDESQGMESLIPDSIASSPKNMTLSDSLSMADEENSDSVLSFCPIKELSCPMFEWASQLSPWRSKTFHLNSPSEISISPKHMLLMKEETVPKLKSTSSSSSFMSTTEGSADCFFTPPESPSLLQGCLQDNKALEDQVGTSLIAGDKASGLKADLTLNGSYVRSERKDGPNDQTADRLPQTETHHHERDDWDHETPRHEDGGSPWSPSWTEPDNESSVPEQETREDMEKVYKEIQKDLYVRATLFYKFLRSGHTLQKSSQ